MTVWTNVAICAAALFACEREVDEAIKRFKAAFRSPDARARASAVAELAKVRHEKTLSRLAALLAVDEREVRVAAARALGEFAEFRRAAAGWLLAALPANPREGEVRVAIFESLGALAEESSLPAIHAAFREKNARVAQGAIRATGLFRSAASIEPVLALLKDLEKCLKNKMPGGYEGPDGKVGEEGEQMLRLQALYDEGIKALQAITKEPWTTLSEWQIWWKRKKGSFKVER